MLVRRLPLCLSTLRATLHEVDHRNGWVSQQALPTLPIVSSISRDSFLSVGGTSLSILSEAGSHSAVQSHPEILTNGAPIDG